MGIFSLFQKSEKSLEVPIKKVENFNDYFTKDVLLEVINTRSSMLLFYTRKDGWIGANKLFLDTFDFADITDFRNRYESIREIFLNESEEVFTEDEKSWLDYIKKHKKDGYEITILASNNNLKYISAKCQTLLNNPDFYILELQDITALHLSEEKAKDVEKLKTKFLSNIGHEFRTPMHGILGFTELLGQTNLQTQQQEYINMIERSAKNLMVNIDALLDLSQMQGGRLQLVNSDFSLLEDMENVASYFAIIAKEKGANLLTFIDPKLPKVIHSDSEKITQIMNSLIQNAIKFTNKGGRIIVEVKLLKRRVNGDCSVGFSVKDNGNGISQEQIALINEPFTAGNHADERLGFGLSLSNGLVNLLGSELKIQSEDGNGSYFNFVLHFTASEGQTYKMMPKKRVKVLLLDKKKIDDASFLTIYLRSFAIDVVKENILDETIYDDVESVYIVADQNDIAWMMKLGTFSKKASVVIFLNESEKLHTKLTPLVDQVLRKPLLPSFMANHLEQMYDVKSYIKEEKLHLKESLTALVVEDNLINQRLIQILLKEYNIDVSTASNGDEAVQMCAKHTFDIVFMDIDMPVKNGILATKEIKSIINFNGKTPIVALTAMAMQGDKEMLLSEGLDDYISKPLTREKLENILNKYLKVIS